MKIIVDKMPKNYSECPFSRFREGEIICLLEEHSPISRGIMMDCYNYNCPFRCNSSSSATRCDCIACPNRSDSTWYITSNHTLTEEEIKAIGKKKMAEDPDYGRGSAC